MSATANKKKDDGQFVSIDALDNFYQTSAFIPMSFALVTTVHETGETGIGPHALLFPFTINKPYSMLLISRASSGTAANIRRTGKCALNYVPFDRDRLQGIANLGYPGMPLADKIKANPYTLVTSPSPENAANPEFPEIISEAFQVIECTWNDRFDLQSKTDERGHRYESHFNLMVDQILVKEKYAAGIEHGDIFPNMPIFCGYRPDNGFWFAEHHAPLSMSPPKVKGMEYQTVFYLANRIDTRVRVSEAACKKLTGIPEPFMKDALKGIVERALKDGVTEIDEAYIDKINAERE